MAWAVEYKGEFKDLSYSTSVEGLLWTVEIELDSYAGAVNDMVMGGVPLIIEHLAPSDDLLLTPIKGSTAQITVWSETQFQYTSLYSSENFKRRVSIYYGAGKTLYWRGYLTTEYSEPYDDTPYEVTITAADGLGLLKDIPYDNDGTLYPTGWELESKIVLNVLGKIGVTTFKEFVNLYEDRMDDANTDSPFDQTQIAQDLFLNSDGTAMDCYTVLSEILKKYNAVIRQSRGEFWIYRPTEWFGDTLYYRYFTAYDTKSVSELYPTEYQFIHRSSQTSTIKDFNGGILRMISPISKFTAEQDYGNRESWIRNYNFDINTYDTSLSVYQFDYWTIGGNIVPLSYEVPSELQGVLIYPDGTGSNYYIFQDFGPYIKTTADVMMFSFEYRLMKATSGDATNVVCKIRITHITEDAWLNNDVDSENAEANWETTEHFIDFTVASVPAYSDSGWQTAEYKIPTGIPYDGFYRITLFATDTAQVRVAYKNVRFYSTADDLVLRTKKVSRWKDWVNAIPPFGFIRLFGGGYKMVKTPEVEDVTEVVSRTYTKENDLSAPPLAQSYILGDCEDTTIDNVIEQFKGALCLSSVGSLAKTATDFAVTWAADYLPGGVVVTSNGIDIIFTSTVPGTDFTGSTTITNVTGDLNGSVVNTQANRAAQAQIDTVTLLLTGGTAEITCNGITRVATYDISRATTALNFKSSWEADFAAIGVTVDNLGDTITFTANIAGIPFMGTTTIVNTSPSLTGTVANTQENITGAKRIDTVTLTGTSGTANILCDGVTKLATFNTDTILDHTISWHTRNNTEAQPLIELIADEMAAQYSRERHLLQANLRETSVTAPDVNVIYNFIDTLNEYDGDVRVFACNRGTFNVKTREWSIDLHEIIYGYGGV